MPFHDNLTVTDQPTLLTDNNVAALRVQNLSPGSLIQMQATVGATPPASWGGSLELAGGQTLAADLTIAQLWTGVAGANRVYARSLGGPVTVSVSHA